MLRQPFEPVLLVGCTVGCTVAEGPDRVFQAVLLRFRQFFRQSANLLNAQIIDRITVLARDGDTVRICLRCASGMASTQATTVSFMRLASTASTCRRPRAVRPVMIATSARCPLRNVISSMLRCTIGSSDVQSTVVAPQRSRTLANASELTSSFSVPSPRVELYSTWVRFGHRERTGNSRSRVFPIRSGAPDAR